MDIERVKYVVIKDKGIVRAIISDCKYDAFDAFDRKIMLPSTHYLTLCANGEHEKFIMPYQFSAVAKLHPEDEWDEETGKKIALKKLSEQYNRSLDKRLFNMYNALSSVTEKLKDYLNDRDYLII
mgnify:CR=1 FL=1